MVVSITSSTAPSARKFQNRRPFLGEPGCRDHDGKQKTREMLGGWATPLKNMSSSVGTIVPNIWKNIKCSKAPTRFIQLHGSKYQVFICLYISIYGFARITTWGNVININLYNHGYGRMGSSMVLWGFPTMRIHQIGWFFQGKSDQNSSRRPRTGW